MPASVDDDDDDDDDDVLQRLKCAISKSKKPGAINSGFQTTT